MSVDVTTSWATTNKYLRLYNAEIEWGPHLDELKSRLQNQPDEFKKRVACTIMLPYYESNTIQDPPQNLLFFCHKWNQYPTRDWVAEYEAVKAKDAKITECRTKCYELGYVVKYEFNPNTRQACNWLIEQAEKSGDLNEDNKEFTIKKLKNLVNVYGGVVICSVFLKPELEYKLKKIANWRTGYFFERLIYETYKPDELIKIKTQELNQIRNVNPDLLRLPKTKE